MRERRREQLVDAFARVLAEHGYAGATIAAVADAAGVSPGLVHHHFASKADLLASLLATLLERFRERTAALELHRSDPGASGGTLDAYAVAALGLGAGADAVTARCWVGVLAEAVRDPALFAQVRRLVDSEIEGLRRRSGGRLSPQDAGAVLAFILGALVMGAFAPRKTAGFAAPALQRLIEALGGTTRGDAGGGRGTSAATKRGR
jgi:TetR/AcrR family transcriptional repressor of bet genes